MSAPLNATSHPTALRTTREGAVATVHLARPAVHNAFDEALIADLTAAFTALGADEGVRAIVLRGDGRSFSAGADLDWMRRAGENAFDQNVADAGRLADMLTAIRDCPRPVVARVHGAAMGGGVGLVAACDLAVAAAGTRFALSEARLGLVPAVIAPFVLPRIGVAAARELFLTGEAFGAERALAIGLVARVVAEDALDDAVAERVGALLAAAPGAQAAVKRLIRGVALDPAGARAFTTRLIAEVRASEEGRAGMAAFLERRPPPWAAAEAEGARG